MLWFQYFKRFCYDTYVVQYSLGHCSLEVELKRPEMATAKGWSGKIHRKKWCKWTRAASGSWWRSQVSSAVLLEKCWLSWHILLKVLADAYTNTMSYHLLLCGLITILISLYNQYMRRNYHFHPILIKALRRMTIHKGVILHEPSDKGKWQQRPAQIWSQMRMMLRFVSTIAKDHWFYVLL